MARTALTPVTLPTSWSVTPVDSGATAADTVNNNSFKLTGNEVLAAWNTGGSTYTVTVHSVGDVEGRSGDITAFNITAGQILVFPRFPLNGWMQSDGNLYIDASNAAVKFIVLHLNP